eukprot:GHVL01042697.1.p2 GENE.GHVL01042697.1~~GHVL01042697.1.p2  ORF type:complete len:374 (+),score=59.14 GHVL01042697.1:44-1165(+)
MQRNEKPRSETPTTHDDVNSILESIAVSNPPNVHEKQKQLVKVFSLLIKNNDSFNHQSEFCLEGMRRCIFFGPGDDTDMVLVYLTHCIASEELGIIVATQIPTLLWIYVWRSQPTKSNFSNYSQLHILLIKIANTALKEKDELKYPDVENTWSTFHDPLFQRRSAISGDKRVFNQKHKSSKLLPFLNFCEEYNFSQAEGSRYRSGIISRCCIYYCRRAGVLPHWSHNQFSFFCLASLGRNLISPIELDSRLSDFAASNYHHCAKKNEGKPARCASTLEELKPFLLSSKKFIQDDWPIATIPKTSIEESYRLPVSDEMLLHCARCLSYCIASESARENAVSALRTVHNRSQLEVLPQSAFYTGTLINLLIKQQL